MKSIVSVIVLLALGLMSGMAYMLVRPTEKRASDWKHLKAVPTNVRTYVRSLFASKPATETPAAHAVQSRRALRLACSSVAKTGPHSTGCALPRQTKPSSPAVIWPVTGPWWNGRSSRNRTTP